MTALMCAAKHGFTNIVDLLLQHHSMEINLCCSDNLSAILYATNSDHVKIVTMLIEAGAVFLDCKKVRKTPGVLILVNFF